MNHSERRGFTLIELLIVVAIIAILASIAVPNFLEAQVRSKVARAKADMRSVATALESYAVDNNTYPETELTDRWRRFHLLTTPIAYITNVPYDPFLPKNQWQEENFIDWGPRHGYYKMGCTPVTRPNRWAISSNGPDLDEDSVPIKQYPGYSDGVFILAVEARQNIPTPSGYGMQDDFNYMIYDTTNGTASSGDVWRLSDRSLE